MILWAPKICPPWTGHGSRCSQPHAVRIEAAVATTHGLFAGRAVERLRGHAMITEVVTTDTVPAPKGWPELRVRSVAGLFAEAIKRIHEGESVSSLFDGVDPTHAPPRQSTLFDRVGS